MTFDLESARTHSSSLDLLAQHLLFHNWHEGEWESIIAQLTDEEKAWVIYRQQFKRLWDSLNEPEFYSATESTLNIAFEQNNFPPSNQLRTTARIMLIEYQARKPSFDFPYPLLWSKVWDEYLKTPEGKSEETAKFISDKTKSMKASRAESNMEMRKAANAEWRKAVAGRALFKENWALFLAHKEAELREFRAQRDTGLHVWDSQVKSLHDKFTHLRKG